MENSRRKRKPFQWFSKVIGHPNVADLLDQEELDHIGQVVVREYEIDLESRAEWDAQTERAMKLAKQVVEEKSFPWPNCANVKYPLMAVAAIQFNARAYPEIVRGSDVVRCKVLGDDQDGRKQDRADRVGRHMSWQLLEEIEYWDEETDKLLIMLPIIGCLFRKTYFCPISQHNESELLTADSVTINHRARSIDKARRITHKFDLYENDIYERVQGGLFLDVDLGMPRDDEHPGDEDAPHEFIEQHRYLDLDGDGYAEPYIVTVHRETSVVVRIVANYDKDSVIFRGESKVARIIPTSYYTKYGFLPNPDGGFYDVGFGQLLEPLNESINTILNQLIDAGTLANTARGWVRGLKKGGIQAFGPGEWKPMPPGASDARVDFFPIPNSEPSPILFQLLGMLVQAAQDITSVKDIMTGDSPGANVPATTTLAMVEQGMKVFSAIYKRIFRSLAQEYKKLFRLNGLYLDQRQYFIFHDNQVAIGQQDYAPGDLDVIPVADPRLATDAQRIARAQALAGISGRPGLNEVEITRRVIDAIDAPDPDKLMIPEEAMQAPPDPKAIEIQAKIAMEGQRLEMDLNKHLLEIEEMIARIEQTKADTMLKIAQAEAQEIGQQFELYKSQMDVLAQEAKMRADIIRAKIQQQTAMMRGGANGQPGEGADNSGGLGPMEAGPDDSQGLVSGVGGIEPSAGGLVGGGMQGGPAGGDGSEILMGGGLPPGSEAPPEL